MLVGDRADDTRVRSELGRSHRRDRRVRLIAWNDREHLALVGDVQRVQPQQFTCAGDGTLHRQPIVEEPDPEIGRRRQFVARRRESAAGRVPQPPRRRNRGEQPVDQPCQRRGVGPDVGTQFEVATGDHHRNPVIADRSR